MSTPFPYFAGKPDLAPERPVAFRTHTSTALDGKAYESSKELAAAVNVALLLGQPLLLTGEPGTGKTELGFAVARELGLGRPFFFSVKSSSEARDLFYQYDAVGRLRAGRNAPALKFVTYQALGLAILRTKPKAELVERGLIDADAEWLDKPVRSLVIIDEIDKAPRDFPNDLLDEIGNMRFRVPELERTGRAIELSAAEREQFAPIVIVTSNSERQLPAPFLRRCAYHHITFPKDDMLERIVRGRVLPHLAKDALSPAFVKSAIDFFIFLRGEGKYATTGPEPALDKKPSTAELVNFVRLTVIHRKEAKTKDDAPLVLDTVRETIGVLLKNKSDLERAAALIEQWKKASGAKD